MPIGRRNRRFRLRDHGAAGSDREPGQAGARDELDRARANRRQIEATILSRLGAFTKTPTPRGAVTRPRRRNSAMRANI